MSDTVPKFENLISPAMQIATVKREIALRERVYPRWVSQSKMSQAEADKEIAAMKAVLHTLAHLWDAPDLRGEFSTS